MFEQIQSFYEHIPWIARISIDYIIIRGVIFYLLAAQARKIVKATFARTEREAAIKLHYYLRAQNKGHTHNTPFECNEGKCSLI